jgi:hypothetical protein
MNPTIFAENVIDDRLAYKNLIEDSLWQRLVKRITNDFSHQSIRQELAERIMNEALGFLVLCARRPDEPFGPSELVDIGWHTFILYTREYAEFCERIAGRFIHHNPYDDPTKIYRKRALEKTTAALNELGPVDIMLWPELGNCHDWDCDSGCDPTDSASQI